MTDDLRRRVLDASVALIEAKGLSALSLREVARRAGVSHQAPYHHFADRAAILAALVEEGFGELGRRMHAADDPAGTVADRLVEVGVAYVEFALDRPAHFRIMFRPELLDARRFHAAEKAGAAAFAVLERLMKALVAEASAPPASPRVLASLHWAVVHGLASLLLDGPLGLEIPSRAARRRHVRAALEAMRAQTRPRRR